MSNSSWYIGFPKVYSYNFLNIHRWFNIINIIPLRFNDGSLELKCYSVDIASQ